MPLKDNAFVLFVQKRLKEVEASTGQKCSLPSGISKYGGEWAKMTVEERAPFKVLAGKLPQSSSTLSSSPTSNISLAPFANPAICQKRPNSLRFSCFRGETPEVVKVKFEKWLERNPAESGPNPLLGEDQDYIDNRNWHRYQIHRLCNPIYGDPTKHRFVLIEASIYGRSVDGQTYIPGEIAMAVFSFDEGLVDNFCAFIDPGAPPLGVASAFMNNRTILALPTPPFDPACSDYVNIWWQLEKFIRTYLTDGTDTTYLFCREYETKKIREAVTWLADKVGRRLPWDFLPYGVLLFQMSKFAQTTYINWLKRQRALDDWSLAQNRDCPRRRRRQSVLEGPNKWTDSDSDCSSSVSTVSSYSTASRYSTMTDTSVSQWSDKDDSDSDDDSVSVSRDDLSMISSSSHMSITSWTAAESSMSISDLERSSYRRRLPSPIPNNHGSARSLPRTTADLFTGLVERFKQFSIESDNDDKSSVSSVPTCREVTTPAGIPRRLGEPRVNYQDWELFEFEPQADGFFNSMDLATLQELGCPHHMVNTHGLMTCPLNIVNRNVFNTIDILLGFFHIRPIEGQHYPYKDARLERQKRRLQVMFCRSRCSFKFLTGFKCSSYRSKTEYTASLPTKAVASASSRASSVVPSEGTDWELSSIPDEVTTPPT